jgi:hypothetical protein
MEFWLTNGVLHRAGTLINNFHGRYVPCFEDTGDCFNIPDDTDTIIIPEGTIEIGQEAFSTWIHSKIKGLKKPYWPNVKKVFLPDSVKRIADSAFYNCGSLEEAILPKGVQTIGGNAFEYCKLLEKVTLPEGLTTIGYRAFHGCPCLKSVTVPKSVTSIGSDAFGKYYDYSIRKDSNVEGFVLRCYVDSAGERYASDAGIEYKLLDSKVPDGFEQSGAKKISETPFKLFSAYDFGFGIYSNEKNNGLYVINQSVLYFISASTGKTSKVYDFSSLVSDTITNTYVCGNKLYAVGSHYTNNGTANSIYIFNLDTKKFVKRISTKIAVSSVAADTNGNIFIADGKYKFSPKLTLRCELQYQFCEGDDGDWAFGLAELSWAPHWMFTVSDMWNCGVTDLHFYQALVTYSVKSHRIQAGYGRTDSGFNCSGGVCRWVPATSGFTFSYNYSF